ncbi:vinorine synthase-like [Silene latifolia]|uniref:vinorine synthase-like n=1 Tax=Silene latifolia TaxID=37657 RepID=UPI003D772FE8
MEAQLQVKVISNEIVKPSCPTPPEKRTRKLSFLDESFPAIHMPLLLVYTGKKEFTKPPLDDSPVITSLKTSLSETLTQFYPLAGRMENEYTVSCNDQGIPFIVTSVSGQLNDYLNSPRKLDYVGSKFLPPLDILSLGELPITTVVPLAFQVNLFECGGVVIGCFGIHKLVDAISIFNYLKYWAAHASGRYGSLIQPDFDTILRVFPPLSDKARVRISGGSGGGGSFDDATGTISTDGLSQHLNLPIKVVAKSFKFNNVDIKKLKVEATSETVPNPTSFAVVVGFVWKHVIEAVLSNNNDDNTSDDPQAAIPTALTFGANLRSRTRPPLSMQSMGNIVTCLHARLDYEDGIMDDLKLEKIVRVIHATAKTVDKKLEILQDENGGETFVAERKTAFKGSVKDKTCTLSVISWCKLGFNEIDFGFGLPDQVIPVGITYPFLRNTLMLVDYTDSHGHGIEVFVCLEDKYMPFLEADSQFMAFATRS